MSSKVRFLRSATPFCCGVPGAVSWDKIPCSTRKSLNSLSRYSPPRSDQRVFSDLSNCFSTSARNSLNFPKVSDFLCIR